jgi:hypothetical protein
MRAATTAATRERVITVTFLVLLIRTGFLATRVVFPAKVARLKQRADSRRD